MTSGRWRRSSRCETAACVEVLYTGPGGAVRVRDSKAPAPGPVLAFDAGSWVAFLAALRSGDLPSRP